MSSSRTVYIESIFVQLMQQAEQLGAEWEIRNTLESKSADNWACSRDITGLSNQAFCVAATKPLLSCLDARPIRTLDDCFVRVIFRMGTRKPGPGPRAVMCTVTIGFWLAVAHQRLCRWKNEAVNVFGRRSG